MATAQERIQALREKARQAEAAARQIQAQEAAKERKRDTRRKVLLGALVQHLVESGQLPQAQVDGWLGGYLKAARDRQLFGL